MGLSQKINLRSSFLGNGLEVNKENGRSLGTVITMAITLVIIVILATTVPTDLLIAALIGAGISWVILPFIILSKLASGIDPEDYIVDDEKIS